MYILLIGLVSKTQKNMYLLAARLTKDAPECKWEDHENLTQRSLL